MGLKLLGISVLGGVTWWQATEFWTRRFGMSMNDELRSAAGLLMIGVFVVSVMASLWSDGESVGSRGATENRLWLATLVVVLCCVGGSYGLVAHFQRAL